MPLTAAQIDRLTRSFFAIEPHFDRVERRFEANLRARGQTPCARSSACLEQLRSTMQSACRTDGLGIPGRVRDRAGWGAEEHALLEALAEQCSYTWTERLEADWSILVSCAVERAMGTAAA